MVSKQPLSFDIEAFSLVEEKISFFQNIIFIQDSENKNIQVNIFLEKFFSLFNLSFDNFEVCILNPLTKTFTRSFALNTLPIPRLPKSKNNRPLINITIRPKLELLQTAQILVCSKDKHCVEKNTENKIYTLNRQVCRKKNKEKTLQLINPCRLYYPRTIAEALETLFLTTELISGRKDIKTGFMLGPNSLKHAIQMTRMPDSAYNELTSLINAGIKYDFDFKKFKHFPLKVLKKYISRLESLQDMIVK